MNTRVQLGALNKGGLSVTEYFNKMKTLGDTLAIIGQPLKDEEFTTYLLARLDNRMIHLSLQSMIQSPCQNSLHICLVRSRV
jgi:hypothetical protein